MKVQLTLACGHTEILQRQPPRDGRGWLPSRPCPEKTCRGKKRVCEIRSDPKEAK